MTILEFTQRVFAFFLILLAIACARPLTFPLTWAFWHLARYPFVNRFNANKIWVW